MRVITMFGIEMTAVSREEEKKKHAALKKDNKEKAAEEEKLNKLRDEIKRIVRDEWPITFSKIGLGVEEKHLEKIWPDAIEHATGNYKGSRVFGAIRGYFASNKQITSGRSYEFIKDTS